MARILIVDDEPDIRQIIRVIVEADGHEVVEAEDGLHGFEEAKRGRFDLVLLDAMMPGLDGYQMLEKLLEIPDFAAPVIMVTGRSDARGMHQEADAGAIDHVGKPFTMEEVRSTVTRMLAMSPDDRIQRRQMLARSAATFGAMSELRSLIPAEDAEPSRRLFGR